MNPEMSSEAMGSDRGAGPTWAAVSTWPASEGGHLAGVVAIETTDVDLDPASGSCDGVVLLPTRDSGPCEVTVRFSKKHEIHRVYVRSTARVYEIYYATDIQDASNEYLCTVRCGPAVSEGKTYSTVDQDVVNSERCNYRAKEEHNKGVCSNDNDDDEWVQVKVPDLALQNSVANPFEGKPCSDHYVHDLIHFEATADISDVSPCSSITLRFLSLQPKTFVHIEEIYIYADPVNLSDHQFSKEPSDSSRASSLFAMLVPGLLQMSQSRTNSVGNQCISESIGAQHSQTYIGRDIEQHPLDVKSSCLEETVYKSKSKEKQIDLIPEGEDSCSVELLNNMNSDNDATHEKASSNVLNGPYESDKVTQASGQLNEANSLAGTDGFTRLESILNLVVTKVEKVELFCDKFEDRMMKPLLSIESRLQQLEQNFGLLMDELKSLQSAHANTPPAHISVKTLSDKEQFVPSSAGTRSPGLAIKAPEFIDEDCSNIELDDSYAHAPVLGSADRQEAALNGPELPSDDVVKEQLCNSGCITTGRLVVESPDISLGNSLSYLSLDPENLETALASEESSVDVKPIKFSDDSSSLNRKNPMSVDGALASALAAFLASAKSQSSQLDGIPISDPRLEINDNLKSSIEENNWQAASIEDGRDKVFSGMIAYPVPNLVASSSVEEFTGYVSETCSVKEVTEFGTDIDGATQSIGAEAGMPMSSVLYSPGNVCLFQLPVFNRPSPLTLLKEALKNADDYENGVDFNYHSEQKCEFDKHDKISRAEQRETVGLSNCLYPDEDPKEIIHFSRWNTNFLDESLLDDHEPSYIWTNAATDVDFTELQENSCSSDNCAFSFCQNNSSHQDLESADNSSTYFGNYSKSNVQFSLSDASGIVVLAPILVPRYSEEIDVEASSLLSHESSHEAMNLLHETGERPVYSAKRVQVGSDSKVPQDEELQNDVPLLDLDFPLETESKNDPSPVQFFRHFDELETLPACEDRALGTAIF